MGEPVYTAQWATFDSRRLYRYTLGREWDDTIPRVAFVMLNPSTADETQLDPTLRRCLGYARAWGCGSFEVANLFALRSTDPKALCSHPDPVGPENDQALLGVARAATYGVVAGWGAHGAFHARAVRVAALLSAERDLLCLATTKEGHPGHPLYLHRGLWPTTYRRAGFERSGA